MASVFEQLQLKYQGMTANEISNGTQTTTLVFVGSKDLVREAYYELLHVGGIMPSYEEFGTISTMEMLQDEGPFWHLKIEFAPIYSSGASTSSGNEPMQAELSIARFAVPIEKHPDYRMIWNNNLYTTYPYSSPPDGYEDATINDTKIPPSAVYPSYAPLSPENNGDGYWCWGKSIADCTPLPIGYCWFVSKYMTKPGVNNFDTPTLQMTYSGVYKTLDVQEWVTAYKPGVHYKRLPRICHSCLSFIDKINSLYNGDDYGDWTATDVYTWMCDGSSTTYTKDGYKTQLIFTRSQEGGWDSEIYGSPA